MSTNSSRYIFYYALLHVDLVLPSGDHKKEVRSGLLALRISQETRNNDQESFLDGIWILECLGVE